MRSASAKSAFESISAAPALSRRAAQPAARGLLRKHVLTGSVPVLTMRPMRAPPRALVADTLESDQLAPLREAGVEVVDRAGIDADGLRELLPGFDALLVRSRTKVTAELL